jgi:hypothetical protein
MNECACLNNNPVTCFRLRYNLNPLEMTSEDVCECSCHDEFDVDEADAECDCFECNDRRIV